jgi:hypothetical protein
MSALRLVSADSHVNEPPEMFGERLDARFRDRAPRVETVDGVESLVMEGMRPRKLPKGRDVLEYIRTLYDAVCTPDFFGFNKSLELQYRGRLDASRTTPVANARRDLFEAMVQVAKTGKGPAEQISSMGCSIKWKR